MPQTQRSKSLPISVANEIESEAIIEVAKLMAISARTAPKGRGIDNITTAVVTGKEKDELADTMEHRVEKKRHPIPFFRRDADSVRKSQAVLLVGVKGTMPKRPEDPINCGACGHQTCGEFIRAEKKRGEDFTGPICILEALDLGIALGSAVRTASEMNVDNRMMYTIGSAAGDLKILDADVIIGVPLSVSGKNPYFDRK